MLLLLSRGGTIFEKHLESQAGLEADLPFLAGVSGFFESLTEEVKFDIGVTLHCFLPFS